MASLSAEAPDPKGFKSWEDAFKYPIPAVRRLQQQLRGDISANRERLRTLVGSSYRDLLGTADSIVQMDGQMQEVELHLTETSRRCNTTLLNKSHSNSARLKLQSQAEHRERFVVASQLAVFRRCPEVLVRILRRGGSILVAAKVLVISRLLHKQLTKTAEKADYVNGIWSRLGRLRQKLLSRVERKLASSSHDAPHMIDALCAYALATSTSSPLDLLRHFHHVRLDAIQTKLSNGADDHQSVLEALRLWIKTLQDTRALFPKQLATALHSLRSMPLLKNEDVQAIVEFEFEIHAQWLGDDVQHFVPYVRREDMSISDASKQLSSWAPAALHKLLSNLKGCLSAIHSLTEIVNLRKGCLELLFSHYHIAGVRRNGVLNGFRDAFEERLLELVQQHCDSLSNVNSDITEILDDWETYKDQQKCPRLWHDSTISASIAHGAKDLTLRLQVAVNGRTESVRMIKEHYDSWLARIADVEKTIEVMRNTRWEDHLDDLSEDSGSDSEIEEEEATLSKVKILLKETDPSTVQRALARQLIDTFETFRSSITSLTSSLTSEDADAASKSIFLIRVLREIKHHLPQAYKPGSLKIESIPTLHVNVAKPLVESVLARHESAMIKSLKRTTPSGRAIWDGKPELPVLPSPWVFRLLKDLEQELSAAGTDIWAPAARSEMKLLLSKRLDQNLQLAQAELDSAGQEKKPDLTSHDDSSETRDEDATGDNEEPHKENGEQTNGEKSNGIKQDAKDEDAEHDQPVELPSQDSAIQQLFDVSYIHAYAHNDDADDERQSMISYGWLQKKAKLDEEPSARLKASAKAYRKRTSLLFALAN